MYPPNSGHHGKSTQYKTIQTKYVFKTSFDRHSGPFQTTLISHCLTSLLPKPTLILAKSLTSDPYNWGPLKRRKSVCVPENGVRSCVHLSLKSTREDSFIFNLYFYTRRVQNNKSEEHCLCIN